MEEPTKDVAIRKRTQIAKANRTMFIWVAVVSVIVGFAIVGSIFLVQKLLFNERVIAAKNNTVATLKADNAVIPQLEAQVRVLNTNQALSDSRANSTDQPVQAVLDALPSDANSLALGASIQNVLLANIPGLTLNSIQVNPVAGIESLTTANGSPLSNTTAQDNAVNSVDNNQISLSFSVSGTTTELQQALTNLEHSIRTIDVTSLDIESEGAQQIMTVQAVAFYEPATVLQLTNMVVR